MGLFEHFPYTNFHELNLVWLLDKMKDLIRECESFKNEIQTEWENWKSTHETPTSVPCETIFAHVLPATQNDPYRRELDSNYAVKQGQSWLKAKVSRDFLKVGNVYFGYVEYTQYRGDIGSPDLPVYSSVARRKDPLLPGFKVIQTQIADGVVTRWDVEDDQAPSELNVAVGLYETDVLRGSVIKESDDSLYLDMFHYPQGSWDGYLNLEETISEGLHAGRCTIRANIIIVKEDV